MCARIEICVGTNILNNFNVGKSGTLGENWFERRWTKKTNEVGLRVLFAEDDAGHFTHSMDSVLKDIIFRLYAVTPDGDDVDCSWNHP